MRKINSRSVRKSNSSFSGWYKQIFEDMEEPRISEVLIENVHNIDAENLHDDEGDNAHNFDFFGSYRHLFIIPYEMITPFLRWLHLTQNKFPFKLHFFSF